MVLRPITWQVSIPVGRVMDMTSQELRWCTNAISQQRNITYYEHLRSVILVRGDGHKPSFMEAIASGKISQWLIDNAESYIPERNSYAEEGNA